MRIRTSQSGVAHLVGLLLIVAVVGVVGFAGYTVWKAGQDKTTSDTTATTTSIKTKADLQSASKLLDTTATQLNSDLDTSALDSDISQLL